MKMVGIVAAVLMCLLQTACTGNEFDVEFKLPADVNDTYTLAYYASDPVKGWMMQTGATLRKGVAEVKCVTHSPTLVYITPVGARLPQAVFYAERGDNIKISGSGKDPMGWNITGNRLTDRLTEWRKGAAKALELRIKDPAKGIAAVNKSVADYVSRNPENPASTILLLTYYDRRADEDGFVRAWSRLKGDATDPKWSRLVSRADMFADPAPLKLPKEFAVNTVATGCDTITFGRVPVLIYFSRNSLPTYKVDIDTLRKLSREFRDSDKRIIAEISFEPDSAVRRYPVRTDSLKGAVRGWMPLGLSDMTARELGVDRVPYAIVVATDGKVKYHGDNLEEAAATFRQQIK